MDQPVPNISKNDIERIVLREYPAVGKDIIFNTLRKYSSDSKEGTYRVWASVLKISDGNIKMLKENIETALCDYRDVISVAEYPEYSKKVGFDTDNFDKLQLKKIIEADSLQYQEWINGKKNA
ncbi:MAG: hypothetical protein GY705_26760 [Bacteroidetes bacterium]|nr:hypothetical protein [Bacteroidota bacterium]